MIASRGPTKKSLRREGGEAGGAPLESRWDEAERAQAGGVRDAGTMAELGAGGLPKGGE